MLARALPIPHRSGRLMRMGTLAFALIATWSPGAGAEEPWSVDPRHPVVATTVADPAPPVPPQIGSSSSMGLVALGGVWLFQNLLSPVDGPTCFMYPTCSGFAACAVRRHGWLLGGMMAADRLMRNHADPGRYPPLEVYEVLRLHDPVSANDFWFSERP